MVSWALNNPDQVAVMLLSLTAVFLLTSKHERTRRWGPVLGLLSQPFWLYATYTAAQWGMFALSCVYVGMWLRGIYNGWWADRAAQRTRDKNFMFGARYGRSKVYRDGC